MTGVTILVEGDSDRRAVEHVAVVLGHDLAAADVAVVAMAGITNLARCLDAVPRERRVTGLYDVAGSGWVRTTLSRLRRSEPFFACDRDLEDELIRALGTDRVTEVIDAAGDAAAWRTLQHQPFHRGRAPQEVLRRFMGTTSGRKLRYAGLLAAALAPNKVPAPLVAVLGEATRRASGPARAGGHT